MPRRSATMDSCAPLPGYNSFFHLYMCYICQAMFFFVATLNHNATPMYMYKRMPRLYILKSMVYTYMVLHVCIYDVVATKLLQEQSPIQMLTSAKELDQYIWTMSIVVDQN